MKKSGIYLLLLIAISLAACSPSEPPATTAALKPVFEEVTFTTEDDRELVGRLYGDGDVAGQLGFAQIEHAAEFLG